MRKIVLKLDKVTDVKKFYYKAQKYSNMYLVQGRAKIPADTFMSLFTLDLEKPFLITFSNVDDETIDKIVEDFSEWIWKNEG